MKVVILELIAVVLLELITAVVVEVVSVESETLVLNSGPLPQ